MDKNGNYKFFNWELVNLTNSHAEVKFKAIVWTAENWATSWGCKPRGCCRSGFLWSFPFMMISHICRFKFWHQSWLSHKNNPSFYFTSCFCCIGAAGDKANEVAPNLGCFTFTITQKTILKNLNKLIILVSINVNWWKFNIIFSVRKETSFWAIEVSA